ncbi:methylated-DNA--[protein]-cysteine S-methyltransferase [Actinospongicola halichondriae]|uniref:methylated-DNA--[protein]-cysteine S-methyltransferase n=1 Tax=Actinospongicola halichondriae TaxID=3236844 RepID=UPI003D53ADF3
MTILTHETSTPAGVLCSASRNGVLVACGFADHWDGLAERVAARFPDEEWTEGESDATRAVDAYVAGDIGAIDAVEVDTGGTEFQQKVWAALRTIPVGATWSYGDLAAAVGNVGAMRAVGSANGANPVSVVVPCHRVVRSDGSLGGYGGGLDRKAWLLSHEGARLA